MYLSLYTHIGVFGKMGKICSKCNEVKELNMFGKLSRNTNGLHSKCMVCANLGNKIYRESNKEKCKLSRSKHYYSNRDKMLKVKKMYADKNKDKKKNYDLLYRKNNKEKIKQQKKDWEYRMKNNPLIKIKRNLRRKISHALKGRLKSAFTESLLGCSFLEFKSHIELQFTTNMSWDNYGPFGWHIDHIIPCYKFNLLEESEQRKCFHFTNQRPLWAKDNLSRPRN